MKNPERELAEIKSIMVQSTRFLSLSGISGILAGSYALVAASLAYVWVYYPKPPFGIATNKILAEGLDIHLIGTALMVLILSIATAYIMSQHKCRKKDYKFWSPASWRFIQALFIPAAIGGIFSFALVLKAQLDLIASITLVFYGIGLLNASNFTLNDIKYLGYCQLILGIIAAFLLEYGLILWTFGFGFLHIFYGLMMYYKYDR